MTYHFFDQAINVAIRISRDSRNVISHLAVCHLRMRSLASEVWKFSSANNIDLVEWPPNPTYIADKGFDLGVVASFGRLIPNKLIQSFPRCPVLKVNSLI